MTVKTRWPALRLIKRFARDESGATAIEYALVASGISIAIAAAVYGVRDTLLANFYNKLAPSVFQ